MPMPTKTEETSVAPYPRAFLEFDSLPEDAHVDKHVVTLILDRSIASIWRDVEAGRMPAPIACRPGQAGRWHVGTLRRFIREQAGVSA